MLGDGGGVPAAHSASHPLAYCESHTAPSAHHTLPPALGQNTAYRAAEQIPFLASSYRQMLFQLVMQRLGTDQQFPL